MKIDIIGFWACPSCKCWHYTAEYPEHDKNFLEHKCDCGESLVVNFVLPGEKQNPEFVTLRYAAQRLCQGCGHYTEVSGFHSLPLHDELTCPDCGNRVNDSERLEYIFPQLST